MSDKATLEYNGTKLELDTIVGSENEIGIDITSLRAKTGMITLDPGYGNTGSCTSDITFINGEKGILRHRGYAIEDLAENSSFLETTWLILNGELPTAAELAGFEQDISDEARIHSSFKSMFANFPPNSNPMAILSSMLSALACYNPELLLASADHEQLASATQKIISKVRTIAAWSYRAAHGYTFIHHNPKLSYTGDFLHMMFTQPNDEYKIVPEVERALDLFFTLHADHEQNCSTSTVRMVGSSRANLFSSVSAGVSALWGPLHGGANVAVIEMLENIHANGYTIDQYVEMAKDKNSDVKLMGFGHRVYKSFDPRAKILKGQVEAVLKALDVDDPLLDIARQLEEVALRDEYFVSRNLYPNVDFYSGILLRIIGIPEEMFTVLFAIGRMPGWIANWHEMLDHGQRISRPRQIYTGETLRDYTPMSDR